MTNVKMELDGGLEIQAKQMKIHNFLPKAKWFISPISWLTWPRKQGYTFTLLNVKYVLFHGAVKHIQRTKVQS